ncbi:MAG: hydrogenase maturation nickel metallochaperone HypA [Candidatus Omnitrophota bacterium]
MHELSLATTILKFVLKEAKNRKVLSVKVALAEDGHTTPQSLSGAFSLAAQGTLAQGAQLDIKKASNFETRVLELEVEEGK